MVCENYEVVAAAGADGEYAHVVILDLLMDYIRTWSSLVLVVA